MFLRTEGDAMNRGILYRGIIYFFVPILTISAERAASYSDAPPVNYWEYVAWVCASLTAGLTALRAFLDQHISKVANGQEP